MDFDLPENRAQLVSLLAVSQQAFQEGLDADVLHNETSMQKAFELHKAARDWAKLLGLKRIKQLHQRHVERWSTSLQGHGQIGFDPDEES